MHNSSFVTTIPSHWDGWRLDKILAALFRDYSRSYLQEQIRQGNITINGQVTLKNSLKVTSGQTLAVQLSPPPIQANWLADETISLNIIYEDEYLLVINKPPGLVTHPGAGHASGTLANGLLHYLPALSELPRSGIIHRLDKDTSGLLVIPKTLAAYTYLVKELASRKIERIYQAVVNGLLNTRGTVDCPIGRHATFRQKQAIVANGKPAITHYQPLEQFRHHSLLSIKLETGRTHQIRVHMAHIQHGIVGDPLYGRSHNKGYLSFERQALHAHRLRLSHPFTQTIFQWEAPLPGDMQTLIETLREKTS